MNYQCESQDCNNVIEMQPQEQLLIPEASLNVLQPSLMILQFDSNTGTFSLCNSLPDEIITTMSSPLSPSLLKASPQDVQEVANGVTSLSKSPKTNGDASTSGACSSSSDTERKTAELSEKSDKFKTNRRRYLKRRVVASSRTRHVKITKSPKHNDIVRGTKELRMSPSSSTNSPMSTETITPPKKRNKQTGRRLDMREAVSSHDQKVTGTTIVVARFQCRMCGLTRFLALSAGRGHMLPARLCECGSTAVIVASWVRQEIGVRGGTGGLGRECLLCPACRRLYCSSTFLKKHRCPHKHQVSRRTENSQTKMQDNLPEVQSSRVNQGAPVTMETNNEENNEKENIVESGVAEVPCCHLCGECFIYETLLRRHLRRQH